MTSPTTAAPASAEAREVGMDALRGIALFGVLMENLLTEFRVSIFEQFLPAVDATRAGGGVSERLMTHVIACGLEAFILFSFLFGAGLAAQGERLSQRGEAFGAYGARRLGFLLALGLTHLFLVWNGDILALYAVLGFVVAPLSRGTARRLLALALCFFVVEVLPLPYPSPFPSPDAMRVHVLMARRVYGFGSFADALAFRVHEVRPMAALLLWSAPRTLALFFLGAFAWRVGAFRRGAGRRSRWAFAVLGVGVGGAAVAAADAGVDFGFLREIVRAWAPVALAMGCAATVLLAFGHPILARSLASLAPLGRMALTCYLAQSVILSALFYGWGLGLFGRLGLAEAAAIGVALFVAQAAASARWLRRYEHGPVEWLWRSFTYGAWQPLRR